MLGLVCYRDAGEKNGARTLCGARFCAVYVLRGDGLRARLSAQRAAKYLQKRRVQRAAFPPDYPCADAFARRGVLAPEEAPLRMAKGAEIILCAMAQHGLAPEGARIALVSARPSAVLETAAQLLVRRVRYLTLCTPDGARLSRRLRWDHGVSAYAAAPEETLRADLAVAFDDAAPRCGCPVLPLGDGALRVRYAAPLPQEAAGWETRQLICALFAAGALAEEDIAVKEVKFPADRGQNANLS